MNKIMKWVCSKRIFPLGIFIVWIRKKLPQKSNVVTCHESYTQSVSHSKSLMNSQEG